MGKKNEAPNPNASYNQKQRDSYKVVFHGRIPKRNDNAVTDVSEKVADNVISPEVILRVYGHVRLLIPIPVPSDVCY
jgi:hypothetical protein